MMSQLSYCKQGSHLASLAWFRENLRKAPPFLTPFGQFRTYPLPGLVTRASRFTTYIIHGSGWFHGGLMVSLLVPDPTGNCERNFTRPPRPQAVVSAGSRAAGESWFCLDPSIAFFGLPELNPKHRQGDMGTS